MFHVGLLGYKASKGGFPLSRNFHVRTHVNFTRVNKIEAMYGKSGVNVKVESCSTSRLSSVLFILPLFYSPA